MRDKPLLRVENVVKKFGEFAALKGVSIDVEKGQIVCFLGPSGCGKTTLLRTIGGFYKQDKGDIYLAGKLINNLPPEKRETVMFFQNYALFPHMNVFENVTYGLRVKRVAKAERIKRAKEILALTKLEGMEERLPDQLSGGQQQRVALARALILNPGLLLLDEPLSNLDANLREYMRDEILKIKERLGLTIIFVTHDQQEAMSIADKIAVMQEGLIDQVGTPFEIYRYPESYYVASFVGDTNFLDASISKVNQGNNGLKVNLDLSSEIGDLKVNVLKKNYENGDEIKAMVRPENIKLHLEKLKEQGEKHKQNFFEGEILKSAYLGEQISYKIKVNGKIFHVKTYNPREEEYLPPKSKVLLEIPEDIHVIK